MVWVKQFESPDSARDVTMLSETRKTTLKVTFSVLSIGPHGSPNRIEGKTKTFEKTFALLH